MRVGLHITRFDWSGAPDTVGPTLSATARAAEDAGVSWMTVMDHWFQMPNHDRAEDPMLEGYTTLGFLAAHTESVRLSVLVTGVTYRHPGLLAKIVATLDVLSGGRAGLGIGAAWYEREHRGLGVDFPPVAERFGRLEEAIQICLQMWSDDDGPYEGRYYRLAETLCSPRPISRPHPPILIGGGGERKTLRLVARYADGCNLFSAPREQIAHKLEVLRRHCDDEGRDYDAIEKTLMTFYDPRGTEPGGFLAEMRECAALGIDTVTFVPSGDPVSYVRGLSERIIPALQGV